MLRYNQRVHKGSQRVCDANPLDIDKYHTILEWSFLQGRSCYLFRVDKRPRSIDIQGTSFFPPL